VKEQKNVGDNKGVI